MKWKFYNLQIICNFLKTAVAASHTSYTLTVVLRKNQFYCCTSVLSDFRTICINDHTFLANISNQKISYAKFDSDYVTAYKENKTDFDTVMADITELFGLQAPNGVAETSNQADSKDVHPEGTDDKGSLVMTDYEYQKLQTAYEETMSRTGEESEFGQEEYLLYGSYEPLTVTITHILNNKSGVNFASYAHTGLPVEVFAMGVGQDKFKGYYDNTDIFNKMAEITGVQ